MVRKKSLGIIGGLGPLASADIFYKIVRHTPAEADKEHFNIVFEQHPFDEGLSSGDDRFNPTARKLYVFNLIKQFENRKLDAVILPCFISHTFIEELVPEIKLPVINMMTAIRDFVRDRHPGSRRLGVLTSNYVRAQGLFEAYFDSPDYELVYPEPELQQQLTEAIYGTEGIKAGPPFGGSTATIQRVCEHLLARGAELLLPGFTEIPTVIDTVAQLPIVDTNRVYAEFATRCAGDRVEKSHRIGIVGGVGPAATVDFMDKIVRHTKARRDQDHVKLVLHHNPQIPDRTQHLIGDGTDPTIQLFAACRHLEQDEVDFIAIPCNTAHAFVDRLQRYLSVPIINMLSETVDYIGRHYPDIRRIGLLATNGTVCSHVYHDVFANTDYELIVPDDVHQHLVMDAIYGEHGVKSGHTSGQCQADLKAAVRHVADRGAQAVILGCTELPLLVNEAYLRDQPDTAPVHLDPTDILAQRCVHLVQVMSRADQGTTASDFRIHR